MNKKAALELSVTGIVVLIIAITVLGLVIFFIKTYFGQTSELVGSNIQAIKRELTDKLGQSGKLLTMNVETVEATKGANQQFVVAVKNTGQNKQGNEVCFIMKFDCISSFSAGNSCKLDGTQPFDKEWVGGKDPVHINDVPQTNWFGKLPGGGIFNIKNLESAVYPIELLIKSQHRPDRYRVELSVYKAGDDKACQEGPSRFDFYQSQTFDIDLK